MIHTQFFGKSGYAVHATFIQFKEEKLPWHVVLTSSLPPHDMKVVGLSAEGLDGFSYADAEYNNRVENFPRPHSMKLDYVIKKENADQDMRRILKDNFHPEGSFPIYVVLDRLTYDFFMRIAESIADVHLWKNTLSTGQHMTYVVATLFGKATTVPPSNGDSEVKKESSLV